MLHIGDKVKVISVPDHLSEFRNPPEEASMKAIFEGCIGQEYVIEGIDEREYFGKPVIFVELEIGEVEGDGCSHTIYIEEYHIELIKD